jgi:Coenzyme PQQ synthesis protein D (PqqD)
VPGSEPSSIDDRRPRRTKDVHEYPLGDELLLYVAEGARAHALNVSARAIWSLCDGSRTVAEIASVLADDVGRPAEELRPDVASAIERFEELGLVEWT